MRGKRGKVQLHGRWLIRIDRISVQFAKNQMIVPIWWPRSLRSIFPMLTKTSTSSTFLINSITRTWPIKTPNSATCAAPPSQSWRCWPSKTRRSAPTAGGAGLQSAVRAAPWSCNCPRAIQRERRYAIHAVQKSKTCTKKHSIERLWIRKRREIST